MNEMIEYKGIGKSYNGEWIVRNFNLSIKEGDFICIVGTSGSGDNAIMMTVQ